MKPLEREFDRATTRMLRHQRACLGDGPRPYAVGTPGGDRSAWTRYKDQQEDAECR